jgi:hypothetical protein
MCWGVHELLESLEKEPTPDEHTEEDDDPEKNLRKLVGIDEEVEHELW